MNGGLNAAAAAETDRQTAISNLQYPSVIQADADPRASTSSSKSEPPSVLSGVETAHEILTPDSRHTPIERSASTEPSSNTFTAIRDGIANLNLGKGMLGQLANTSESTSSSTSAPAPSRSDQELGEMT